MKHEGQTSCSCSVAVYLHVRVIGVSVLTPLIVVVGTGVVAVDSQAQHLSGSSAYILSTSPYQRNTFITVSNVVEVDGNDSV